MFHFILKYFTFLYHDNKISPDIKYSIDSTDVLLYTFKVLYLDM